MGSGNQKKYCIYPFDFYLHLHLKEHAFSKNKTYFINHSLHLWTLLLPASCCLNFETGTCNINTSYFSLIIKKYREKYRNC